MRFCFFFFAAADLTVTWEVLLVCGGILPLLFTFVWIVILRYGERDKRACVRAVPLLIDRPTD